MVGGKERAGPFVHEELLELDGEGATRVRELLVDPSRKMSAPKFDVFPDVQMAPAVIELPEIGE